MFGLTEKDTDEIITILAKHAEIEQAIIFGSRAKGNYKNGSDVDIAIKGENITHELINAISQQLNEETLMPYQFDILDYFSIKNNSLNEHINRVGKVFYRV